jgi:hypothetical protein
MVIGWELLFLASKWLFVGLIYLVLFLVVLAVRREMGQRLGAGRPLPAPALAAGRLRLIQSGSDERVQPGQIFLLPRQAVLGAAPTNELPFYDQYLSARHARLRWDGAGWWLEDLGSKNGSLINGRPCPPNQPQPLPLGAKLAVGDMVFELIE